MRKEVKYFSLDGIEFDNAEECMEYELAITNDFRCIKNNVELYDENFQRVYFPVDFFEKLSDGFYNIIPDFDYIKITCMQEKIIRILNFYWKKVGSSLKIMGGSSKYGFYRRSSKFYVSDDAYIDFIKSIS